MTTQQHQEEGKGEEQLEQALLPGLPEDVALDCIARIPHSSHSNIRPVCRKWSNLLTAPSFRRRRDQISASEDLVFLVQAVQPSPPRPCADLKPPPASYSLTLFNATLATWHRIPSADPIPMFAQIAAVDNRLILVGGWDPATLDPVADVRILDLATMRWRRGRPMATARSFFACAAAGGRVYVAGGHDAQKNALSSAEAYDVEADEWVSLPPMAEERDESRGLVLRGKFWAVSGYNTERQGRFAASAEWYDADTRRWTVEEGVWDDATCASCFGFGGEMWSVDSSRVRGVRTYEDGKGWRAVGPAPEGVRSSSTCAAVIGEGEEERVFVTRGDGSGGWVMDLSSRNWVRVEAPFGFSGSVFSAAAIRI